MAIGIAHYHDPSVKSGLVEFIVNILERIPAACEVSFGAETAAHHKYLKEKLAQANNGKRAIDAKVLEKIAMQAEGKGSLSRT